MPNPEDLQRRIEEALPGAEVTVVDTTGTKDHFRAEVRSPAFAGLSRIQQHRMVYDVFADEIGGAIHALSLKTEPS